MKLKFKINKTALIRDAFIQNNNARKKGKKPVFPFWTKLENRLWKQFKNEPSYYLINALHCDWALNQISIQAEEKGFQKTFLDAAKILEKIYREIAKTKEFKHLLSETEKYKIFVEKQWEKNKKLVLDYFKNTLGLKIPTYTIMVYIFHPKSYHGQANGQTKTILWGHSEDWKNYSTVYLAHEILHILTYKKLKNYNIMHALIELATDNELRIKLNKKGKYFNVGHKNLKKLERKILPHWKEFLNRPKDKKDFFQLEKEIIKRLT